MEEVPHVEGEEQLSILGSQSNSWNGNQESVLIAVGLFTKWSKANPVRNLRISSKCSTECAFPICMVLGSLHTDQFWVQDISAGFLGVFRVQQTYAVFGHLQWEDGKIWIDSRRWVYCLGRARSKGWQLVCSHPSHDTEDGNKMTTHAGFGSELKKKSAGSITNVVSFHMISKANIFHVITTVTLSLGYLPSENIICTLIIFIFEHRQGTLAGFL